MRYRAEARAVLERELVSLQSISYAEAGELARKRSFSVRGASGTDYTVVVWSFPDDPRTAVLRVTVAVDDGGWSAILPMSGDLLVAPDSG